MNTVIQLDNQDDKAQRQKAFRKQFAENLNAALDRRGAIPVGYGRVTAVAELFGVSQNTAANWLRGEGVPELARLPEIAETLNTTVEQLVVGAQSTGAHAIDERYTVIDIHGSDADEAHSLYMLPEALREVGLPRGVTAMRMASDDMDPYLRPGDVVFYDPRVNRLVGNGVYVLRVHGALVVRRIQRGTVDGLRLICDNNRFGSETLSEEALAASGIEVVGHVVGRLLVGR
ncbi:XRE family transcriptional regulator [Azospira restricta]|uniref:LexA family transcriptional regulator n=1 Tax=Azospira restricta TaxID=404405 RepID=A0A974Y482_9RHOO|nr:LexA family transcriptional regulator [Azospira restricta]QRJ64251.1 LexA family transcriptional regulator [Azospira restricta]